MFCHFFSRIFSFMDFSIWKSKKKIAAKYRWTVSHLSNWSSKNSSHIWWISQNYLVYFNKRSSKYVLFISTQYKLLINELLTFIKMLSWPLQCQNRRKSQIVILVSFYHSITILVFCFNSTDGYMFTGLWRSAEARRLKTIIKMYIPY